MDSDGYLHLTDFFTAEQKAQILNEIKVIESWPEAVGKWMHYYEPHVSTGEKILCRMERVVPYSQVLSSFIREGPLPQLLSKIMGEPVVLYKDKINFKLPGGGSFLPHQDAGAYTGQGQKNHITALIAIDPMTLENGCLDIASNEKQIWQQRKILPTTDRGAIIKEWVDRLEWKPLTMNLGDILIFGSYIPHRSGPNLTSKSRRGIYLTYNPISEGGDKYEQYYQDKRKHFPPPNERETGKDYSQGAVIYNLANPIFN